MIIYEKTLQQFFAELTAYLEEMKSRIRPDDIKRLSDINYGLMVVGTVASNPQLYADYGARVNAQLEKMVLSDAFIPENNRDNSVYLMYRNVVNSMGDLYGNSSYLCTKAQLELLFALKGIKYKNSKMWLKRFVYPLMNPAHFAVKQQSQYS